MGASPACYYNYYSSRYHLPLHLKHEWTFGPIMGTWFYLMLFIFYILQLLSLVPSTQSFWVNEHVNDHKRQAVAGSHNLKNVLFFFKSIFWWPKGATVHCLTAQINAYALFLFVYVIEPSVTVNYIYIFLDRQPLSNNCFLALARCK